MAAYFDLKVGESLSITGGIIVTLQKKSGQLARLMVDAPTNIKVEVKANGAAAQAVTGITRHL
jgi:hypothetical protein